MGSRGTGRIGKVGSRQQHAKSWHVGGFPCPKGLAKANGSRKGSRSVLYSAEPGDDGVSGSFPNEEEGDLHPLLSGRVGSRKQLFYGTAQAGKVLRYSVIAAE